MQRKFMRSGFIFLVLLLGSGIVFAQRVADTPHGQSEGQYNRYDQRNDNRCSRPSDDHSRYSDQDRRSSRCGQHRPQPSGDSRTQSRDNYSGRYQSGPSSSHEYQQHEEPIHPQFWLVEKDWVKCNSVKQYEHTLKQLIHDLQQRNDSGVSPWFTFVNSDTNEYTHILPMQDLGDIQKLYESWTHFENRSQAAPLFANFEGDVNSWDTLVMETIEALSYWPPENVAMNSEEEYFMVETIHVSPGQERLFEEIIKKWVNGFREYDHGRGAASGWNTYKVLIGNQLPTYIMVSSGKSMEDFQKHTSISLLVGERDKLFSGASFGVVTDYAWSIDQYIPELSFLPGDNSQRQPSRQPGYQPSPPPQSEEDDGSWQHRPTR